MKFLSIAWFLSLLSISLCQTTGGVLDLVVIGGTSNLAQKYLWKGLFYLTKQFAAQFSQVNLYGTSSSDSVSVLPAVTNSIKCISNVCKEARKTFIESISSAKASTEADYKLLCNTLDQNVEASSDSSNSHVRIFYLSISPKFYGDTANWISSHCRHSGSSIIPELRVVFEKPFGRDLVSARELARMLQVHLSEKEIYRVDHYLGKPGVEAILPFRIFNRDYIDFQTKVDDSYDAIVRLDHVRVVMSETETVEGRGSYYDSYGVIRDVLQNHLTMILAMAIHPVEDNSLLGTERAPSEDELLSLNTPNAPTDQLDEDYYPHGDATTYTTDVPPYGSLASRMEVLKSLKPKQLANQRLSVAGVFQYETYNTHVQASLQSTTVSSTGETNTQYFESFTPTAAVIVLSSSILGENIPLILAAGKALKTREAYAELHYEVLGSDLPEGGHPMCIVRFHIQGGAFKLPTIVMSPTCRELISMTMVRSPGRVWHASSKLSKDVPPVNAPLSLSLDETVITYKNSYISVLSAVVNGNQNSFMSTEELVQLWKLWDPIIEGISNEDLKVYPVGADMDAIITKALGIKQSS